MPSPMHFLLQQTSSVGGLGGLLNSAEFIAAFRDLGNGAVDLTLDRGTGVATFVRATAGAAKLSTGLWKLDVASGVARSHYIGMNTAVGAYGGYLAEGARTNLCLQSRDLSNASWTKVNTTAAKDQVGIDGVTNSASSLTATLGGGTCLQTITEAATDSTLSLFIRRITGTGTVTIQQGATNSEISAQLNSVTYTQVALEATVLNPVIGIVLGTNGDKIAVDCVGFENGAFSSTPIPTTTIAVTRNADSLTYPTSGNVSSPAGTAYMEYSWPFGGTSAAYIMFTNDGDTRIFSISAGTTNAIAFFKSGQGTATASGTSFAGASRRMATRWSSAGVAAILEGGAIVTSATLTTVDGTALTVGAPGTIKNLRFWSRSFTDAQMASVIA